MTVIFIDIAAFCGLRFGEISALTRANVDCSARVIRVRQSLSPVDGIKDPKTRAGIRDLPMPQHVADLLGAFLELYFLENDADLIFATSGGAPLTCANFHGNYWKPLQKRAGLFDEVRGWYHFHALRHFAASWMIEHGMSLIDAASILGHATFDMTLQRYAHTVVGGTRRHDLIDRMAASFLIAGPVIEVAPTQHVYLSHCKIVR